MIRLDIPGKTLTALQLIDYGALVKKLKELCQETVGILSRAHGKNIKL